MLIEREPTDIERQLEEEIRRMIRVRFAKTIPRIEIRLNCPAMDDTGLTCDLPFGHSSKKHEIFSKDRQFTKDCTEEWKRISVEILKSLR